LLQQFWPAEAKQLTKADLQCAATGGEPSS